jgi:hypothetical protein
MLVLIEERKTHSITSIFRTWSYFKVWYQISSSTEWCYGRPIIFLLFPLFSSLFPFLVPIPFSCCQSWLWTRISSLFLLLFPSRADNLGYGRVFPPFLFLAMDCSVFYSCFPLYFRCQIFGSVLGLFLASFTIFTSRAFTIFASCDWYICTCVCVFVYRWSLIVRKSTQPLGHSI